MSFRGRTALSLTLLCLGLLSGAALTIYLGTRQALLRNLDQALLAISRVEVASALDSGQVHLHEGPFPAHGYQRYAQIARPGGEVLARSANLSQPLPRSPWESTRVPVTADLVWQGQSLRVAFLPCADGLVAQIATPLAPIQQNLNSLTRVLLIVLMAGGVLAALGSYGLATHLTRPLEQLAQQATGLGPGDLSQRLSIPALDREVELLAGAFNSLLGRLQANYEQHSDFLADASHELRTPLTNLIGSLEVAARRPRTAPEYAAVLDSALQESRRLARLVGDLLTLSQLDRQALEFSRAPVELLGLARASLGRFEERAATAGIELALTAGSSELWLHTDPDRLRQVLDNLLDNALRYAPRGTPVVLSLTCTADEVTLGVRDSGPGLELHEQEQVFERFYRPDPARLRQTGGSGLGLAIVRSLAAGLGGSVGVVSQPGQGAFFYLRLARETAAPYSEAP